MRKTPPHLTHTELRRVEAVHAAATAFASGLYETQEELWALTVFFDRYIETGAEGTMEDFGPADTGDEPAQILRLVPKS
jgi:hypothetical protein